ncbi:hypothetical protein MED297_03952 [Reinekea sp. MED297]|uniref:Uncharacterized protein n=1 Tax=Reinekea blandensis MED297 TaxID=314283 RepID=A4BFZ5_9GAMM|nr:hypothetical protein MED297_03952 [Reinekea sp. MED297] [Reinekea blandensis MED297]
MPAFFLSAENSLTAQCKCLWSFFNRDLSRVRIVMD